MNARNVLLTLHIVAVTGWLGADILQYALAPRLRRESPEVTKAWARQQVWLHDVYYAAVAVVIAVTGVALVLHGHWSWSSTFIWVGVGAIVGGATLGGGGLGSMAKKRLAALEAGDAAAAEAAGHRHLPLALIVSALPVIAIFAMVQRWRL
jgi:hypothetical protein